MSEPESLIPAPAPRDWQRRTRTIAGALTAVMLVVAAWMGYGYWRSRAAVVAEARQHARQLVANAAAEIDEEMRPLLPLVGGIATDLGSGALGGDTLLDRLRQTVETSPQLAGIGVAYAPTAYDPALQLYAPYYVRRGETIEFVELDSLYDYTEPGYDWYHRGLELGTVWVEPFLNDLTPGLQVEYAARFHAPGGDPMPSGVVHAAVPLAEIDSLIASLDLGEEGYPFLLSGGGTIISHPLLRADGRRGDPRTEDAATRDLRKTLLDGMRGETGEIVDPATGEPSWIFYEQVPSTGWTVGVVYFHSQLPVHTSPFRQRQIRLVLASLAMLFFGGVALMAQFRTGGIQTAWGVVTLMSALSTAGIGAIWYTAYQAPPETTYDVVFASEASLQNFRIDRTRQALRAGADLPVYVPTGVFVQSLEFLSANNVTFTGYVWQRYPRTLPDDFARGVIFPEAVDADITEVYRRIEGNEEVIGWFVRATVRENYDYSRYPLDQQAIWLRLWHPDFDRSVILVPDFDSYRLLLPTSLPGLESDFTLPGWTIQETYFAYQQTNYNATFGVDRPGGVSSLPELHFHIVATRDILTPFFANLMPVIVAAFMAFGLLVLISTKRDFGGVEVLGVNAALFFIIILAQLDLRNTLQSERILYVEYFYFAMYGAIVLVSLDAIIVHYGARFAALEYRDNLILKLMFWPMTVGALLAITTWVFY